MSYVYPAKPVPDPECNDEFMPQPHRVPLMTPNSYSVPMPEIVEDPGLTSDEKP